MENRANQIASNSNGPPRITSQGGGGVEQFRDEKDLYGAVAAGNVALLRQILGTDPHLVDNFKQGCFGHSILHVAVSKGHADIVTEILARNPELAEVLDSRRWSPLHLASVKGQINVLQVLLPYSRHVARVITDQGDTILHLCVKHNQLRALERLMQNIKDSEFANRKDAEGNTILHLAVMLGNRQVMEYLLLSKTVDLYATNVNGNTILDIADKSEKRMEGMSEIKKILKDGGALKIKHLNRGRWLTQQRDALMVVASLMATMAFQAGVSPPGGVWQDNKDGHRAGETVMAYNYPDSYPYFLRFNTVGFVGSLSTILLLITGLPFRKKFVMWILVVIMWATISAMAVTYAFSITVVTPKKDRGSLTNTIVVGVIVWGGVMTLLLVWHTLLVINKWFIRKYMHPCPNFQGNFFRFCFEEPPWAHHPTT